MKSVELREKRASVYGTAKKLIDAADAENRNLSSEEEEQYQRMSTDLDTLADQIEATERKEKLASVAADLTRPLPRRAAPVQTHTRAQPKKPDALRSWLLANTDHGDTGPDAFARAAEHGFNLNSRSVNVDVGEAWEKRTATKGGVATGAELAPSNLPDSYVRWLTYVTPILNYVTVKNTSDARDIPYPIVDDSGNLGAIIDEAALIPDADFATSSLTLKAWKYCSKIQKVSIEFLLSAVGNIENEIGQMLAERIGRAFNAHVLSANAGTTTPQGLLNAASTAVTLGTRGTLTADSILDAVYAVDPLFASNITLVMNRASIAAVRKLKDSQGRYIWQDSFQQGEPPTVAGYPVLMAQEMPTLATAGANKVVLAADLSKYVVRSVGGLQMMRSDERYMEYAIVAFSGIHLLDGRWMGPAGAIKAIVNPAS